MRNDLAQFLTELPRRKREWGKTDCLMILADWVKLRRGFDPAARWRGTYSDEAGAMALLKLHGGHAGIIDEALGAASRTKEPGEGDVAVIRAPQGIGTIKRPGALCLGEGMVALMTIDIGLVMARLPIVAAWKV